MTKMRIALDAAAAIVVGVLAQPTYALMNINVVSDGSWKSSDVLASGWQTGSFDDSGWSYARAPYPQPVTPESFFGATAAQAMWYDPTSTANGMNGSIEAYFRKTLNIDFRSGSLPVSAQALISVDDDYEFYVNGTLVFSNKDGGYADKVDFVDFTSYLRNGTNVLAIHAVDGGWNAPHDRLYERVLFDAKIVSTAAAVPEPEVYATMLSGIGLLFAVARRRSSNQPG